MRPVIITKQRFANLADGYDLRWQKLETSSRSDVNPPASRNLFGLSSPKMPPSST